ncbi:S-layer homology domain-containing protein [Fischerella sp. JS2]|uniref:S-layer homology domain-containing protein n=1 Tax=Fischerella sp. JS2 TaxID=2597771 RepID=UPI0028EBB832|nr:S-layer homology domain-containing protein [Fischerella sp. JS2]
MSRITPVALATTFALVTIICYPSKTLSQTIKGGRNTAPPTGCLSGYPDGKYRGSQAVTRYEFAAGMNACLNQVEEVIPNQANLATKSDFDVLIKRQIELNRQVRELNQRVDNIKK